MNVAKHNSLSKLAAEVGTDVPCASNLPLDMSDSDCVWFVEKGTVDLFIVEREAGIEQAAHQHLLRAKAGRLLPAVTPHAGPTTLGLIAKGLPDTLLRRIPVSNLAKISSAELAEQVDFWITEFSNMLSRYDLESTQADVLIEAGKEVTATAGVISAERNVVWASNLQPGAGLFMGLVDPAQNDPSVAETGVPLVRETWITLIEPQQIATRSSESLAEDGLLMSALACFHNMAFMFERLNRRLAVVDEVNLERERLTNRQTDEQNARHRLFDLYNLASDATTETDDKALTEVLEAIGQHEGIDFKFPERASPTNIDKRLVHILDASGVRMRRVRLDKEGKWWKGNCSGAMLAFKEEDGRPVALVPGMLGRYREVDGNKNRSARVTATCAASFKSEAWLFYQPLASTAVRLADLFRLGFKGTAADFTRFLLIGLLGGLFMLLPAVLLGMVADEVIQNSQTQLLYVVVTALVMIALIGAFLQVLQGMTLMRLEGRISTQAEAAFMDRLLRLPPRFLQRFSAGDLALRSMTFQTVRGAVQQVVAHGTLSVIFLLPVFLLIFLYDPMLGGIALGFSLISLAVTIAFGLRQIAPHTRVVLAMQSLTGRLFQLINGISILRVESAEGSAYAVWARGYRTQKEAELQRNTLEEHLQALSIAMPLLAGAILLVAATLTERQTISIGDFLVVYTAFMVYQGAVANLGAAFSAVAAILPTINSIQPFLAEPPEEGTEGEPVDTLSGDIRLDHVSFRYDTAGPLILDDISIHARPGEFVAITGESGAGKSTVFQLLLGLIKPNSGAVYYDGRDLLHLNIKQVRRRIGAIPQHVQLHPEDIWDNIVSGNVNATSDDAWAAARLAAVHREINAMPMKMLTSVGAGVDVTSGGESQRIVMAHALISHPRILLLDEATNWLDNESQAKVMENLLELSATKIIIAHRLSTLRHADRIYVMQAGRVVEEGDFAALMGIEGVFHNLVRRQLA